MCLGDVAATGPQPHETLERIHDLGCQTVLGNADAFLLAPATDPAVNEEMSRVADIDRWCANQLTWADRAFRASFPPTIELPLSRGCQLLAFHGSPRSFDDRIAPDTPGDTLDRLLVGLTATIAVGGHTHIRMLYHHRGIEIINPGSVGLAYQFHSDGSVRVPSWADWAIIDASVSGSLEVVFRRVPYDRAATRRAMVDRGMPHVEWWTQDWR